ncbi:MAG TPA: LysR substrate-binding domain-containing protein [Gaiellaceae bacterium]|jgi:DNA-binding transcriptional LysR family regulator|nr:LysR substrate-binding domain-containing protein [Gaiellaceae bacterium]
MDGVEVQLHHWLGIELRHFAALQALASERSFGRAAAKLGYTQSAISQQIATLERIVGEKLVERPGGPRPIALTEAGRLLLRHAESIVARLQAAQADLHALRTGEAGMLRIGTFQSVGARLLPEIVRRFTASWPAVDIVLVEMDDEEIEDALERGELDVGFVLLPTHEAPLETVELLRDRYVLVTRSDSPLATGPLTLEAVGAAPLVGFRSGRSLEPLEAALHGAGVELRFAFRSNDNPTVQGLVAAGLANAVMPRLTVDERDARVAVRELPDVPPRVIAIARHRDRYHSPAARGFVETALAAV